MRLEFYFGTWSLHLIEQELGRSVKEMAEDFQSGQVGVSELLTIAWAGINGYRRKNKQPELTKLEAADLLDDHGGLFSNIQNMSEAFVSTMRRPTLEADQN